MRHLIITLSFCLVLCCFAEEAMCQLPKPHYHPDPSDPDWLRAAVQFHGHLGPWATAGLRAGMAARRAVGAEGYFDVAVTVEGPLVKPPHSCFLDGLQVSTGATLGKRNLTWVKADRIVVRVKNTRTGKVAEVRPTPVLLRLLTSFKPQPRNAEAKEADQHDHHEQDGNGTGVGRSPDTPSLEAIARQIAAMPQKEVLQVKLVDK